MESVEQKYREALNQIKLLEQHLRDLGAFIDKTMKGGTLGREQIEDLIQECRRLAAQGKGD